jgi:hypothetical protein
MSAFMKSPVREPRRGEVNEALLPHVRRSLHAIHAELIDLNDRAALIQDDFLAMLIATAADECRDQLRDDLILRENHPEIVDPAEMPAGEPDGMRASAE